MAHPFKHLKLIIKHRHRVIANASHMGIFFHALRHDLSKFSYLEFHTSSKYYIGDHSPVYEERLANDYFSTICQHHTRRNKHHWEYWTDFFGGRVIAKQMPYKYALEYVCDVISASMTYNEKGFKKDAPYLYFKKKMNHYFMNEGTKTFLLACFKEYAENGFKNLKKKNTKPLYEKIMKEHNKVDIYDTSLNDGELPKLKK